eukprot:scaffold253187_cov38-Prasinocladus_malaysianus.AAC.1
MSDALAVSYRWQPSETKISAEQSINMNPFQMQAVVDAIRYSGVTYVWLDRLSVPQMDCPAKYTLLARMMAVYGAAKLTLALRSRESDKHRYHQRAWTFQEFCTCRKLRLATEADPKRRSQEDAMESVECMSVTRAEHNDMIAMRKDFQESLPQILPLWLYDHKSAIFTKPEALKVLRYFRTLDADLTCVVKGDKIRALCPLLARTPVESSDELVSLVNKLASASGEDLSSW